MLKLQEESSGVSSETLGGYSGSSPSLKDLAMTPPPPPLAKSELVYRALREDIIAGRYGTGFRLVLGQIAKEMNVSPVPVREAIRRLEAERLVTFTPNVGAQVATVDVDQYSDVMQTLAYLEGAATALAAPHLTDEDLAYAQDLNDQMVRLLERDFQPATFHRFNRQFHTRICSCCPNDYLFSMLEQEWERVQVIRRTEFPFEQRNAKASVDEHAHLLDLIRGAAEPYEIELAARAHKLRTRDSYVKARKAS